nr:AMP-binding protein [Ornithinimicrobium sp. HY1793]
MSPNRSELTPLRFLERSAAVFPDHVAIVYGERRSTYAEFAAEAQQLAAWLTDRIDPGDRVAFLAPNVPEPLIAHFAVPLAGGVLVAINSRLARPEVEYILNHSEARVFFADSELLDNLDGIAESAPALEVVVQVDDPTVAPSHERRAAADLTYAEVRATAVDGQLLPWSVSDENQLIAIDYTSGTTGSPKGVMYSHRGAYLGAMGAIVHNQLDRSSTFLWTLPMFHCNGWCGPWGVTGAAATQVCLRAVRGDAVWEAIDTRGVTHLWGAPTVLSTIAGAPEAHPVEQDLRITTAGSPPSPTIIATMEDLGITVTHVYGLTEVYGPFTITEVQDGWSELPGEERARLLARQGVGMIQAESVRVVDTQMQDVPADGETFGELVLRGNNVMVGYYKDPEATEAAFAGGWFHSGDLGVMHPDGYVEIKDRAKDVIISGGENISSVEVEQAIVSHPAVVEAAVIGVADEKWGERPRAFVTLRSGASVTDEELVAHVRSRLAGYKVPREFVRLDELPHTATGKIVKFELRENG